MGELRQFDSGNSDIARKADGNPEGKGLNGFLLDWYQSEPRGVVARPRRQVLAELFTSLLVLSATFKYRPVVGAANYLYWINGEWSLSLIAPDEWSQERRAGFAGACALQRDMTWTIAPPEQLADDNSATNCPIHSVSATSINASRINLSGIHGNNFDERQVGRI